MTQAYRQKVGKGKSSEENDEMVKQVREASWNSEHWEVSLLTGSQMVLPMQFSPVLSSCDLQAIMND